MTNNMTPEFHDHSACVYKSLELKIWYLIKGFNQYVMVNMFLIKVKNPNIYHIMSVYSGPWKTICTSWNLLKTMSPRRTFAYNSKWSSYATDMHMYIKYSLNKSNLMIKPYQSISGMKKNQVHATFDN